MGDYFCKDGKPHEVGIIVIFLIILITFMNIYNFKNFYIYIYNFKKAKKSIDIVNRNRHISKE